MVAYSFNKRFVVPIMVGLGLADGVVEGIAPKRQTIRADGKRRHAQCSEEVQLYTGMRTKACKLIGVARCTGCRVVELWFEDDVVFVHGRARLRTVLDLDEFARKDGFREWGDMKAFWRETHPEHAAFFGKLIEWEPLR